MFSQEPIEWPEKVEILVDRLESESSERALSREERALMDVYETVPILESEDGLHEFWQSGVDHQRVINSFDLIGAATLVDPLNASRWCETRSPDRDDYSETESDYLATIEEDLPAGLDEAGITLFDSPPGNASSESAYQYAVVGFRFSR